MAIKEEPVISRRSAHSSRDQRVTGKASRRLITPKVVGSNPTPATTASPRDQTGPGGFVLPPDSADPAYSPRSLRIRELGRPSGALRSPERTRNFQVVARD